MSMERSNGPLRYGGPPLPGRSETTNLAELLERILDKGIIIAGDISISLVDVELLRIKLRLLIASVDKAREMGVNWWENDPWLSARAAEQDQDRDSSNGRRGRRAVQSGQARDDHALGSASSNDELDERLGRIEQAVERLVAAQADGGQQP